MDKHSSIGSTVRLYIHLCGVNVQSDPVGTIIDRYQMAHHSKTLIIKQTKVGNPVIVSFDTLTNVGIACIAIINQPPFITINGWYKPSKMGGL